MTEEELKYLGELVKNEMAYKVASLVLTTILLISLITFWIYCTIKDNQTKKFREEWRDSLNKEQKELLKQEDKLKVK